MYDRWDVRLNGFDVEVTHEEAAERIARAFGVDDETARQIVGSMPLTVKRDVPTDVAERYFSVLKEIGADVSLDRRATDRPPSMHPPAGRPPSLAPPAGQPVPAAAPPVAAAAALPARPAVPQHRMGVTPPLVSRRPTPPKGSFPTALVTSFAYPFQVRALPVLAGVALMAQLASYVPIVGGILSGGIFLGYMFTVIRASANGDPDLPAGGDFTDFGDFATPIVRFYLAIGVCLAPAIVVWQVAPHEAPWFLPALLLTGLLGSCIAPATIITAAHATGCLGPLNPVPAIQLIFRIPGPYALTTLAVGIVGGMNAVLLIVTTPLLQMLPLPFIPGFLANAIGLVLPIVGSRMLGLLIHHYEDELGLT